MLFSHSFPLCVQTCSWGRKCDLHNVYQFHRRCLARGCAHTSGLGPSMAGTGSILCVCVCVCVCVRTHTRFCVSLQLCCSIVSCVCWCGQWTVCGCVCACVFMSHDSYWILFHSSFATPQCADVASKLCLCECVCVCVCVHKSVYKCACLSVSHQSIEFCYTAAFLLHCAQVWPVMLCLYVYVYIYIYICVCVCVCVCKSACVSYHSAGFCVPLQRSCCIVCRCGQWAVCACVIVRVCACISPPSWILCYTAAFLLRCVQV